MPEYLDDPSVLTKEQLKTELLAHNVELPGGNPPKDVFVQLYLQNLTVQNQPRDPAATLDTFSSDDDLPPPVVSGRSRSSARKATKKKDKLPPGELDVTMLTDDGLRDQLLKLGVDVGPVVASTRNLYEKKLQKLQENSPVKVPLLVLTDLQVNRHGSCESDLYSDKEDEMIPEPDVEPEPVLGKPVGSRGKTLVATRTRSGQHHTVEKIAASEQSPEEEEVLKELFLNDNSPTGITATCRRPIRGAAGRPMMAGDLWNYDKRFFSPLSSKLNSYSYKEHQAVLSSPTSFSASSRLLAAAAPPAATSKAAWPGPLWKKLLLLAMVAGFLFLVYQAMEADSQRPFQGVPPLEDGSSA